MPQASTVSTAFVQNYASNVYMLSQQIGSKMQGKVRVETVNRAENAFFDRLGEADAQEITSRHGDTPLNEIPHSRRRITPADYNTATLIDNADQLKMLIDPRSPYARAQAMELGRKTDDIIIAAALGDASTGKTGSSTVTFQNDSVSINGDGTVTTLGTLAVSGTEVDMSLNKILLMMEIFNLADVDPDIRKYWMVAPKTVRDMLQITEIGSVDYTQVKAIYFGNVEFYSGFNFFWSNRITKDAASSAAYRSLAWAQDGIILGQAEGIRSRISERDDKNYSMQVYSEMSKGAVRLDGDKVHECLNDVTA
jgi:hypothetical protein